jgi:hypothetical protein
LSPAQRKRLAESARRLGTVRFRVAPANLPAREAVASAPSPCPFDDPLPEGEYDFAAALRLAVVNETLTELYAGFKYPREITAGLFTRARLEALSDDVPPSPARIGPLRLTAPLTVEAVNGTDHLLVTQQFSLEFRARGFPPHTPAEVTVSSLRCTARFGVALGAEVDGDKLLLRLAGFIQSPTSAERLRLTIAADSPVQPKSAKALAAFAEQIDSALRLILTGKVSEAVDTISPVIHLPVEAGGDISVHDVGVRTHRSGAGDVVVVGVRVATDALSDPGVGDPDTLGDPFTGGTLNAYVRIHEGLFRKLVKQALCSGELLAAAAKEAPPEFRDALRIDDADAEVRDNEVRIVLDVRIVDACGVVIHTIDINARVTVTFRFTVFGGELFVTRSGPDIDASNADVAACLVTGGLELVLVGLVGGMTAALADAFRLYKHFQPLFPDDNEEDGKFEVLSAALESPMPVPGTEVLPRAEAVQSLVGRDDLHLVESLGTVSLRRDDVNTYVYARFVRRPIDIGQPSTPLVDADVQLIDQDVPAPIGDDVVPPRPQSSTTTKDGVVTRRESHFVAPTGNQVLAKDTTDDQGRVAFVLQPDQLRTTAGTVVTTVSTENLHKVVPSITTSEEPVEEHLPDVYFRVTPKDGPAFNTRTLDKGFVPNLRERRIGTVTAPLTFETGKGPVATE